MKNKDPLIDALRGLYVLSVLSVFLPWFTYDAKMMGYCCGYNFLKWLLIPLIIIAAYLIKREHSTILLVFAEFSMIANLVTLVIAFGRWQETRNIITGFHWEDGFHTAMPTYWISVAIFVAFFVLFQCVVLKNRSSKKETHLG